jgi:hypothetical protein
MGGEKMNKTVHVRVLYTQGCPNASPVIDLIERVGKEIGHGVAIETVLVTSQEKAVEFRFLGSPTVQINGLDIDPFSRGSVAFGLG